MIVTVHDLKEFESRVDFSKDVFFTWETRNEGRHLPKIAVDQKLYGVGRDGESLVVYNRVAMVTADNTGDAPNLYAGIQIAIRKEIKDFEAEAARFAAAHGCKAVAGDLKPSPLNAALSSMLSKRLEAIERRVAKVERCAAHQCAQTETHGRLIGSMECSLDRTTDRLCQMEKRVIEDENNYGRALALIEDRVRDLEPVSVADRLFNLEEKVFPPSTFEGEAPKDHETRLQRLEKSIAPIIEGS